MSNNVLFHTRSNSISPSINLNGRSLLRKQMYHQGTHFFLSQWDNPSASVYLQIKNLKTQNAKKPPTVENPAKGPFRKINCISSLKIYQKMTEMGNKRKAIVNSCHFLVFCLAQVVTSVPSNPNRSRTL